MVFLIITFAATYILQFVVFMYGLKSVAGTDMLIPATVAIICMFLFKSKALNKETKIIFAFFLIFTILYFFEGYVTPIMGSIGGTLPLLSSIIAILGLISVIILNLKKKWREELKPSKLFFGKNLKFYIIIPVIYFVILFVSLVLNYVFGLGIPEKEFNLTNYFMAFITLSIMYGLFLWPLFFGEEYGWRVYLQDRLFPLLGGYKGVLILGIIWGIWHSGTIILGMNYPGQPILGNLAMIFGTIVMGIIFSYAVLKTGSVWIAVLLHLITDVAGGPSANMFIATPVDSVFSFGPGIYGMAIMAIFAIILLKSNLWKKENIPEPST
ncbi:MAG: CPBP family intramembrane metalloprotease [Methanobacterium sp.]|nr:CPBP family intramembrane metalloprotease [Methanobacterium sp.]